MAQLFADAARAYLSAGIAAGDTTISISSGGALFPVANGTDWLKAVLQDASGIEIVYVTAHTSGSSSFTVMRGQEGSTARSFAAGSVFGIRVTSADMAGFAGKLSDAPSDGKTYGRKDAAWAEVVSGGGAMVHLGTVTANAAASADITGLDTLAATYGHMVIIADSVNLSGSSGTEIRAFFQNDGNWGGSNFQYSTETRVFNAAPSNAQSNAATFIPVCPASVFNSATPGVAGTNIVVNIYSADLLLGGRIDWKSFGGNSSGAYVCVRGSAMRYVSPRVLQGIRFAPSTGTMFGVFRLYGIRKS